MSGEEDQLLEKLKITDLEKMTLRQPDPETLRQNSLQWLAECQHCLIDQWPDHYHDLSFETKLVYMQAPSAVEFWGHDSFPTPFARYMAAELDNHMHDWDNRFIRLNSRSPKDGCWPMPAPITCSGREAISMIKCSERCLDDIVRMSHIDDVQRCYVALRRYEPGLRIQDEYRCFVKDRELIAVTHYDYHRDEYNTAPRMAIPDDGGKELRANIQRFFDDELKTDLPSDNLVFDIWDCGSGSLVRKKDKPMMLVEINPYGMSDPCHFYNYNNVENASTYIQYEAVEDNA